MGGAGDEACEASSLHFPSMALYVTGFIGSVVGLKELNFQHVRENKYLLRPSLGDYTAALPLHSPTPGQVSGEAQIPGWEKQTSLLHGRWQSVWPSLFPPTTYYVPSTLMGCFVHSL